jgi:F420-dependent oxidoreductase-like protein
MRAPVTLDLHLPNFNYPDTTPDQLFERLVEIVAAAEMSGFSSVTVMDHLHQIPNIGPRTDWMLEGNTILAGLAGRTSRVNLGLLVGGVTYRNPALMAKITTTLDVISGGRAVLGLGAAWFEDEHDAYGIDFPPLRERFERLEDALRIARAMFTQPESSVAGTHHSTENVLNSPQPLRGDIPILVGGSGERKTLRLVAQYADACNVFGDVERSRHLMEVLDSHCEAVGRDPAEITRTRMAAALVAPTHEQAMRKLDAVKRSGISEERLRTLVMAGDADSLAEQTQAFLDVGIEGLTIRIPDVHDLETVALVGETLSPLLGSRV